MIEVRLADEKDLGAIVRIYNQGIEARAHGETDVATVESKRGWFRGHSADERPVVVAERGGVIVGWASLSDYRPGRAALRHTAEISYYVDVPHQQTGVGTELLGDCIARCPKLGIRILFAILIDENEASIALLRKHGFQPWGHLPGVAEFDGKEYGHLYYGLRVSEGDGKPSVGGRES